ncbi:dephospho-CoA kinase [Flavobacteriales bacterium]|nr:dephospho-CoA kinase [Flavobacteriales bacterium]MDB9910456.1 dephospho-CoA kinase [Flavobacteriales bacterium]
MKKIGLTGGIGVGKTYVSKIFNKIGIPIFNADEQAKKCMVDDANLKAAVQLAFGENMYLKGVLQKEELAKIVFNNSENLAKLNALVHPIVKQKFEDWCSLQSTSMVIKEAAILFESDAHLGLDSVVCVNAPEKLRIERVQKRDGSSVKQIQSRMSRQMPQAEKEELADFLIVNDQVQLLLPQVLAIVTEME